MPFGPLLQGGCGVGIDVPIGQGVAASDDDGRVVDGSTRHRHHRDRSILEVVTGLVELRQADDDTSARGVALHDQ